MHTDAVAGMFVTYTCQGRIGLVQALACHPLPRMCALSQGLLFKWRTKDHARNNFPFCCPIAPHLGLLLNRGILNPPGRTCGSTQSSQPNLRHT